MSKKLDEWKVLYDDAKSKRGEFDANLKRQSELYEGSSTVHNTSTGKKSGKPAHAYRNMVFELIETQINNKVPLAKVTPRDADKMDLALDLEGYLKMEMDRMDSEVINDTAERGVLIHGTGVYFIGWDESKKTPVTQGELYMTYYPISRVYPQPGVSNPKNLEYIFTIDRVSVKRIKNLYNKTVDDHAEYKGLAELITVWYYNKNGYVCKFGWIDDQVIFDVDSYELRQIEVCKDCLEPHNDGEKCLKCGNDTFNYITLEDETLEEDILTLKEGEEEPSILIQKGKELPYYKIKRLPFVFRKNINAEDSIYGVSDADILSKNQESSNKITTKMEENILKAGSFVTKLKGISVPTTDETLKLVTLNDPRQADAFKVFTVQANMQQDDILQERMYQFARSTIGITDSLQGKRDPTAESGKAKEISAAQAGGRLESKVQMKNAAYAEIYEIMFMFLLAYCDERRTYSRSLPDGTFIQGSFSRYNYLDGEPGRVYYNDRFLFSVDNASILTTSREAMWQENTRNFQAGTFGNPVDPSTLMLYWNIMKGLGYPLAKEALTHLQQQSQELPFEIQQAIMQNPEILDALKQMLSGGGTDVQNSK